MEKPNRLARIRKDKELIQGERERESKEAGGTREGWRMLVTRKKLKDRR